MPTAGPARELRRAEFRRLHATWLAADLSALSTARAAVFRGTLRSCTGGVVVAVAAVALMVGPAWPSRWWTNPLSLLRLGLAIAGVAWIARTFLFARPDEGDAQLAAQDGRLDDIVRRMFAQLRAGATYEPQGTLPQGWTKALGLDDPDCQATHVVRWRSGDIPVEAGEAGVHVVDPAGAYDVRRTVWVATGRLRDGRKARLLVRARASAFPVPGLDARLRRVDVTALGGGFATLLDAYDVRATDTATAASFVRSGLAARLIEEAASGRRLHLSIAWRDVVALVECDDSWFHRLHPRLGGEHVVAIGETLDLLDALVDGAAAVVDAYP